VPRTPPSSPGDDSELLARLGASAGICANCRHRELKASDRSVFLRCRRADDEPRFPRYPPLPVLACPGWQAGWQEE
jgi:hypothetical protein